MYKAFEGANGWYVAWEQDGFHGQPPFPRWLTEREARRDARERNREPDEGAAAPDGE